MKTRSTLWRMMIMMILFLVLPLSTTACFENVLDTVTDTKTSTVNAINDAIDSLNSTSANAIDVLQKTEAKLTDDTQSTIKTEVQNLLDRTIQSAGVEARCDVDFLRERVKHDLERIKAELVGGTVPDSVPAVCNASPVSIDMSLDPNRRNLITFGGYNLDASPPMKVTLVEAGKSSDVSQSLSRQSHFLMTLNLGSNGIVLTPASQKLVISWKDQELSTVQVIQPTIPTCKTVPTTIDSRTLGTVTYRPPHTRGDADFEGHGPRVTVHVTLLRQDTHIDARVDMTAVETQADFTTASGIQTFTLYTAPAGNKISSIVGQTESPILSYVDSNHTIDSFSRGGGDPVKRYDVVGDVDGDDAGVATQVTLTFNTIQVQLTQTTNCTPPKP